MNRITLIVVVVALAIGVGIGAAVWALTANREKADTGVDAHGQQCDREPVAAKIARAAYAVREGLPVKDRITEEELARFLRAGPKNCPPG
jgi:hypothetical protein